MNHQQKTLNTFYSPPSGELEGAFAFGMPMPCRSYTSENYRFGFNGMEKDDEMKGSGNSLDFGARIYDSRLGKFLSTDPAYKEHPWYSTYVYAGNMPIRFIDEYGLSPGDGVLTTTSKTPIRPVVKPLNHRQLFRGTGVNNPFTSKPKPIFNLLRFSLTPIAVFWPNTFGGPRSFDSRDYYKFTDPCLQIDPPSLTEIDKKINNKDIKPVPAFNENQIASESDDNDVITLYRGVHSKHPMRGFARKGIAMPGGEESDGIDIEKSSGGNYKVWSTNWTMSKSVANFHANKTGKGGVVLTKQFKMSEIVPNSEDPHQEMEIIVPGIVTGAEVSPPSNQGTPSAY